MAEHKEKILLEERITEVVLELLRVKYYYLYLRFSQLERHCC